jgi:dynactin 6
MAKVVTRGRCVVCSGATLRGDILLGAGCVIHPQATLVSDPGCLLEIGRGCVVEELVRIECSIKDGETMMVIGDENLFECGCTVRSSDVGNCTIIEPLSVVGPRANVPSGCVVGAMVKFTKDFHFEKETIVVGGGSGADLMVRERKGQAEENAQIIRARREALEKRLPREHEMQ